MFTYLIVLRIILIYEIFYNKVIQWATYHKDDPPPPEDDENKEKRTDDISSWDSDFLKVDQGTLFELILAANYLDIKVHNYFKPFTSEEFYLSNRPFFIMCALKIKWNSIFGDFNQKVFLFLLLPHYRYQGLS